jgi:SAM-dependent methyltransferase
MPQTWHYGLIAKWWAEFNHDGPEIAFFQHVIESSGEPALDAGCGTGRLLLPYLRAGLDVDGCDISADMIALCRERAAAEGLTPTLFVQPMHELDPPRLYRTIVACGVFGIGSTREQDVEALRRVHASLEPGGTLAVDIEVPYANARWWPLWTKDARRALPDDWPPSREQRTTSDGSELALRARAVDLDPLDQRLTLEMRAEEWRDGELVATEERLLTERLYFRDELLLLLERVGFVDVVVRGGHTDEEPTGEDDSLVFLAKKPRA